MSAFSRLRAALDPKLAALLMLVGAFGVLAAAWTFEAFGFLPCELCLIERYPYYAALPLAAAAMFFARNGQVFWAKIALAPLVPAFLAGAGLSAFHAGVEWKFWPGPSGCTGLIAFPEKMADFHSQLQAFHAIRCDEAALRILGLSLAGWGVFAALALAVVALLGATAPKKA